MNNNRQKPEWYIKTENILYERRSWTSEIADLERDLSCIMPKYGSSVVSMCIPSGADVCDRTAMFAIQRADGGTAKRLNRIRLMQTRLNEGLRLVCDDGRMFVSMRYDFNHSHRHIRNKIRLNWKQYYDLRSNTMTIIAKSLKILKTG